MNDDDVLSTTSIKTRQDGSASCADVTVEILTRFQVQQQQEAAVEDRVQQYIRRELLQAQGKSESCYYFSCSCKTKSTRHRHFVPIESTTRQCQQQPQPRRKYIEGEI